MISLEIAKAKIRQAVRLTEEFHAEQYEALEARYNLLMELLKSHQETPDFRDRADELKAQLDKLL